jgi:hypothetical protein
MHWTRLLEGSGRASQGLEESSADTAAVQKQISNLQTRCSPAEEQLQQTKVT